MRAAFFEQHGPVGNIRIGQQPDPELGSKDVIVRVRAASLNGFDPMILAGTTELKTPLPMIPLGDCAGEIVAMGEDVEGWSIGDRVVPHPFVFGEGMTGETRLGTAAELARFPAANLFRIPDNVSFEDAACLPIAYGTAHRMMYSRGKVKSGEKVLILGATGGVGVCAVELAKARGCEVIACGSSGWKLDRLKEIGADHVIDTSRADFEESVRSIAGKARAFGGGGVDVIINYIGGETWAKCLRVLTRGGRMLTCGATAGFNPTTDIRYIWTFEHNILGSNGWLAEDQRALLEMTAQGKLKPRIHAAHPLENIGAAVQSLIDRQVFGKVVITP